MLYSVQAGLPSVRYGSSLKCMLKLCGFEKMTKSHLNQLPQLILQLENVPQGTNLSNAWSPGLVCPSWLVYLQALQPHP